MFRILSLNISSCWQYCLSSRIPALNCTYCSQLSGFMAQNSACSKSFALKNGRYNPPSFRTCLIKLLHVFTSSSCACCDEFLTYLFWIQNLGQFLQTHDYVELKPQSRLRILRTLIDLSLGTELLRESING